MNKHIDTYLTRAAEDIEFRKDKYRTRARQTASRIVALERENSVKKISIKVKVDDEIRRLAAFVAPDETEE